MGLGPATVFPTALLSHRVFAHAGQVHDRATWQPRRDRQSAVDTEIPWATLAISAATGLVARPTDNLSPRPTESNQSATASPSVSRPESAIECRRRART